MTESVFRIGQRWLSKTEVELGLGLVADVDSRSVKMFYPAGGAERRYAIDDSPLSRIVYHPGDLIRDLDEVTYRIESVTDEDGLVIYQCRKAESDDPSPVELPETRLSNRVDFSNARRRLLSGQIDSDAWFQLRYQCLTHLSVSDQKLPGLLGGRIEPIAHQLYIASRVGRRFAPRVLLADEVGLGKTIEACLIMCCQLQLGMVQRVLVLVPEPLINQWYVELRRRFNLRFRIFNQEQYTAIAESGGNPFEQEQLILCDYSWLFENADRLALACEASWDLLIADEAHHLHWTRQGAGEAYQGLEQLSRHSNGLLLLTATPEQWGEEAHFGRLRLIDPHRFHDYDRYLDELQGYKDLANLAGQFIDQACVDSDLLERVGLHESEKRQLRLSGLETLPDVQRRQIVQQLIDYHGTGRVFFRNTRRVVEDFPRRRAFFHPLPEPEHYQSLWERPADLQQLLHPESAAGGRWCERDPRCAWLLDFLRQTSEKSLLIANSADTVMALHNYVLQQTGQNAALFHEGLSLIQRDRSAAYFADSESGSPLLLCSEIGSEGRNFQFCHQLVLFDLPLNPDLLEQRIGRLDRIGQDRDIVIHVPFLEDSPQSLLQQWHRHALGIFEHPSSAAAFVFEQHQQELKETLKSNDSSRMTRLVAASAELRGQLERDLESGRDRLLELSSFDADTSKALVAQMTAIDQDPSLYAFMEKAFDIYGVHMEERNASSYIVRPTEQLHNDYFPMLQRDGLSLTFDRRTALSNEDLEFLTWEHPMVSGTLDMVEGSEQGRASVVAINNPDLPSATLLLEAIYRLDYPVPAISSLHWPREQTLMRLLVDEQQRAFQHLASHEQINASRININPASLPNFISQYHQKIQSLLATADEQARQQARSINDQVRVQRSLSVQRERDRLLEFRQKNPTIRLEEIEHLESLLQQIPDICRRVRPVLDAARLIIVS